MLGLHYRNSLIRSKIFFAVMLRKLIFCMHVHVYKFSLCHCVCMCVYACMCMRACACVRACASTHVSFNVKLFWFVVK